MKKNKYDQIMGIIKINLAKHYCARINIQFLLVKRRCSSSNNTCIALFFMLKVRESERERTTTFHRIYEVHQGYFKSVKLQAILDMLNVLFILFYFIFSLLLCMDKSFTESFVASYFRIHWTHEKLQTQEMHHHHHRHQYHIHDARI